MKHFCLLWSLIFVVRLTCSGQDAVPSKDFQQVYGNFVPILQETATGGFYAEPPKSIKGHPRYLETPLTPGKLTINDIQYHDIPLSYDIYSDNLVTFHPVQKQRIILKSEKVSRFVLEDGTTFIFKPDHPGYFYYRNGIYELVWENGIEVLVKHHKHTKIGKDGGQNSMVFYQVSDYFLVKDGEFHAIRRKKQVLKLLGLDRKELKPVLKKNGIRYRTMKKEYLKAAAALYSEGLTEQD